MSRLSHSEIPMVHQLHGQVTLMQIIALMGQTVKIINANDF